MPERVIDLNDLNASRDQNDLFRVAERCIPGAGLGGYSLPDDVRFIVERGEGSRLRSVDGRWYVDYVGGAGANVIGHCHPEVVAAVQQQAARGMHYFGTLNDLAVELAEKLADIVPCAEKVVLTTTGSEATFYAMRIARAYSGRTKVLKFEGAYHGNHDYSSFSLFPTEPADYPRGKADTGGVPEALAETVLVAPFNDLETAERIIREHREDLALVVVEPVQRIIFAHRIFLEGLRRICDENGVLLMFDEVVTGFRLALGGGQQYFDVTPDLASFGKVVGGGGPGGCVAGRGDVLEAANPKRKGRPDYAYINGTLHGNPLGAAAGLATIGVLEQSGFYDHLFRVSDDLLARLQKILDDHALPAIAAGRNSLWQILYLTEPPTSQLDIMNSDTDAMRRLDVELLRRGIYVLPGVRRFVSSVTTEKDIADTEEALDAACRSIKRRR
jgi:glutamate-1-semialdehyde 2,1-aminomutase